MSNGWKAVRHRQENASKTWKAERKTEEEVLKEEKKTKTADLHLTQLIAVRQPSAALDFPSIVIIGPPLPQGRGSVQPVNQ